MLMLMWKRKAHLQQLLNVYASLYICTSPFSSDLIKNSSRLIKVFTECNNISVQYLHSAWFLDGRTSILVTFKYIHA